MNTIRSTARAASSILQPFRNSSHEFDDHPKAVFVKYVFSYLSTQEIMSQIILQSLYKQTFDECGEVQFGQYHTVGSEALAKSTLYLIFLQV